MACASVKFWRWRRWCQCIPERLARWPRVQPWWRQRQQTSATLVKQNFSCGPAKRAEPPQSLSSTTPRSPAAPNPVKDEPPPARAPTKAPNKPSLRISQTSKTPTPRPAFPTKYTPRHQEAGTTTASRHRATTKRLQIGETKPQNKRDQQPKPAWMAKPAKPTNWFALASKACASLRQLPDGDFSISETNQSRQNLKVAGCAPLGCWLGGAA